MASIGDEMPVYSFDVFEVESSYYEAPMIGNVLGQDKLKITDSVDDDLHRTQAEDTNNDQTLDFVGESDVTDYTIEYLDFAQINGAGPEFELYAMEVDFADGSTKYFVISKDPGFMPSAGDELAVTTYSTFSTTTYGNMGAAVCFAKGTLIRTNNGHIPVENIKIGSQIQTKDNGLREVLWIGKKVLRLQDMQRAGNLFPVFVNAGVLGNNTPLLVSQQHRLLIKAPHLASEFGRNEVFVKAKHLAQYAPDAATIMWGIRGVTYFHLLLSTHEVIFANGAAAESFYPGPMALSGISRPDRAQIGGLFPNLCVERDFQLARPCYGRKHWEKMIPQQFSNLRLAS